MKTTFGIESNDRIDAVNEIAEGDTAKFRAPYQEGEKKMKHLPKTAVILAMVLLVSCDENMMGAGDASTPESCILYAAPGAEVDGGDGASEGSPLTSVEGVMTKTAALKSECGDGAEVRIAEGALSEDQYTAVRAGLKSRGHPRWEIHTNQ